jgi:hypothetical protein
MLGPCFCQKINRHEPPPVRGPIQGPPDTGNVLAFLTFLPGGGTFRGCGRPESDPCSFLHRSVGIERGRTVNQFAHFVQKIAELFRRITCRVRNPKGDG